jgi:hypothetical protein
LLPVIMEAVPGHVNRFLPETIYANSVATVTPQGDALSSTAGFLLMALYAAVALIVGGVLLSRRDA